MASAKSASWPLGKTRPVRSCATSSGKTVGVTDYDRQAAGHRFRHAQAETLPGRRLHVQAGLAQQGRHVLARNPRTPRSAVRGWRTGRASLPLPARRRQWSAAPRASGRSPSARRATAWENPSADQGGRWRPPAARQALTRASDCRDRRPRRREAAEVNAILDHAEELARQPGALLLETRHGARDAHFRAGVARGQAVQSELPGPKAPFGHVDGAEDVQAAARFPLQPRIGQARGEVGMEEMRVHDQRPAGGKQPRQARAQASVLRRERRSPRTGIPAAASSTPAGARSSSRQTTEARKPCAGRRRASSTTMRSAPAGSSTGRT